MAKDQASTKISGSTGFDRVRRSERRERTRNEHARGESGESHVVIEDDDDFDRLLDGPDWDVDRRPRRRAPARKLAIVRDLLSKGAQDRLRGLLRACRATCDPIASVAAGQRGRPALDWNGVRIGTRRAPRPIPIVSGGGRGFGSTLGRAHHRDANFDRVLSMRAPWHPGVPLQAALLRCLKEDHCDSDEVVIPIYRASMNTPQMRERAEKQAPDAFWIFHSGQGGGAFSLDVPIQAAVAARLDGYAVTIETVTADRFLRTGTYLATRVLRAAGIRTNFSEERIDRPHHDGLWRTKQKWDRAADRLASRLSYWARDLLDPPSFADGEIPELILTAKDRLLPGVAEALATGSGLDWLARREAAAQGLSRAQIGQLMRLQSWRPLPGTDGFWLMQPAYRERMGLRTILRPVLIRGHEDACMRLIQARFPTAEFRKRVVIEPTADGIANGERNVRRMESFRGEILVAVDHAQIHWGSVLDLDLFFRQRNCYLSTILPSTYAVPDFALRVLGHI